MREIPLHLYIITDKKGRQVGSPQYGEYRVYDSEKSAKGALKQHRNSTYKITTLRCMPMGHDPIALGI